MRRVRLSPAQSVNVWGSFVLFIWLILLFISSQNEYLRYTDLVQRSVESYKPSVIVNPTPSTSDCELDQINWSTGAIILTISRLETNLGRTGVGLTHHNLTGLRNSDGYLHFDNDSDSIYYSVALWDKNYTGLSICDGLAKWKTGNSQDRSEDTLRYINNFRLINKEAFLTKE